MRRIALDERWASDFQREPNPLHLDLELACAAPSGVSQRESD
jgi:hypothetical protein